MNLPETARDILVVLLELSLNGLPIVLTRQELAIKSNVHPNTLDRHLSVLRSLGFVEWQKTGRVNRFTLSERAARQMEIYRAYKKRSEEVA